MMNVTISVFYSMDMNDFLRSHLFVLSTTTTTTLGNFLQSKKGAFIQNQIKLLLLINANSKWFQINFLLLCVYETLNKI